MDAELQALVSQSADRMLPRLLRLLEQVCAPDSGTGNRNGNRRVIELLLPLLREMGAEVEQIPDAELGCHLAAHIRPQEKPRGKLLLMAHLDTVFPPGSVEAHPFRREGDWIYGLGAGDCKGGVLTALFGVLILKETGQLPPWDLTFLLNCDEEIGSPSGQKLFRREASDADCAMVFEGARQSGGKAGFVTARRGVILGDIFVEGKEAHAGKAYLEGRSAVLELAHQIIRLYSFNDYDKGIYYNAAPISGGRPNGVVAGEAHAQFCVAGLPSAEDFRIAGENLRSLSRHVTVDGCRVSVSFHTLFPAMERTEQSSRLYACVAAAAQNAGLEPAEIFDASATDACWVSGFGVPAIDALGPAAEEIHTMNEHVCVSSIRERIELAALSIYEVCRNFKTVQDGAL